MTVQFNIGNRNNKVPFNLTESQTVTTFGENFIECFDKARKEANRCGFNVVEVKK
jgi:hypothetical protein